MLLCEDCLFNFLDAAADKRLRTKQACKALVVCSYYCFTRYTKHIVKSIPGTTADIMKTIISTTIA